MENKNSCDIKPESKNCCANGVCPACQCCICVCTKKLSAEAKNTLRKALNE